MSSLKQLRGRMKTVSATMKITTAMKMISVSRLRKAHAALVKAYPYADEINRMVRRLVRAVHYRQAQGKAVAPSALLDGHGKEDKFLVVAILSDDGLCGQFNQSIIAKVEEVLSYLKMQNKKVDMLCFGKKGGDMLRRTYPDMHIHIRPRHLELSVLDEAQSLTYAMIDSFYRGLFDTCVVVYSRFISAAVQRVAIEQVAPIQSFQRESRWQFLMNTDEPVYVKKNAAGERQITIQQTVLFSAIAGKKILSPLQDIDAQNLIKEGARSPDAYDYEPVEDALLAQVLPQYIQSCMYKILLDTAASESAARLMAMDNATRNAGEMMTQLQKKYHHARQEIITNNLIEIISGSSDEKGATV